ncbi:MAG: tRNA(1)(Val) (adenine(37)-N(6))-methyltransferase [uncultured Cytophagales bacterium]|uniref:tRNA1(Val) (adenine(37)-N6)-methyltransferase n=1 Tax=uncultured Cytophagales bacterium TaxID=158755 RepID=A0A6J4JBU3_9SPHI|nr:MAG: tRNA(1)(Val) (adenine(37)-N(6))-methyltransferase [uncultured Cytophagales bacterium]
MPNSYFQFKQFRVEQGRAAMKVCTDACVLGAYAGVDGAARILDVGTGTGLLALMVAQRNAEARIDAVEVDEGACAQATDNANASPWAGRIRVIRGRIQDYDPGIRYDLILSNPPFYENHLKRPAAAQNVALHGEALSLPELAAAVHRLLGPAGRFVVLLPPYQAGRLEALLFAFHLFPADHLHLHDRPGAPPIRRITTYTSTSPDPCRETELFIRDATGAYTDDFVRLLKPYYLYL